MLLRLIRVDDEDADAQQFDSLCTVVVQAAGRVEVSQTDVADIFGKVVRTVVEIKVSSPCKLGSKGSTVAAVEEAFGWALEAIRELLFRYREAADTYVAMPARENLPFVLWMSRVTHRFDGSVFEDPGGMGMYEVNGSGGMSELEQSPISDEELDRLCHMPWDSYTDVLFQRFNTFALEAREALHVRGDYRATILNCATAAECLLEDIISHALWWEGLSPSEALPVLLKSIYSRVKSEFPKRFGGAWLSDKSRGPVRQWHSKVARYRDRVIHGGYQPTSDEALRAGEALSELRRFLGRRVLDSKVRARYPYLSLQLLGAAKLRAEGVDPEPLRSWYDDADNCNDRFDRWRAICRRLKIESISGKLIPDTNDCPVFAVVTPQGIAHYAVDLPFALAAKIRIPGLREVELLKLEQAQQGLTGDNYVVLPFVDFGAKSRALISRSWCPAEEVLPGYEYSKPQASVAEER